MKTLFLSIGHNWGKNGKAVDQWASGNKTTEAVEAKKIVDAIIARGIPGVALIKVPEWLNLPQRISWINSHIGNHLEPFAMEFHMDSGPSTAEGASVWYNDDNQYTLGEWKQFLAEYTRITGLKSRHVNSDTTDRLGQLGFVSEVKCASLLIELGFISNPTELKVVQSKGIDWVLAGINKMNAS